MTFLFLAAQLFPMWALPSILIFAELMRYFGRKARFLMAATMGLVMLSLVGLLVLYFWKSGWVTFPEYVKSLMG